MEGKINVQSEADFLEILCNLPEPIKHIVHEFYKMASYAGRPSNEGKILMAYLYKVLPAFIDPQAQGVWRCLTDKSNNRNVSDNLGFFNIEQKAQKIAHALLLAENFFDFIEDQYKSFQEGIRQEKKVLASIQHAINLQKGINPFGWTEDNVIKNLVCEEEKVKNIILQIQEEFNDIRYLQTSFMLVTRQSKGTGKAVLYARFLSMAFRTLYGTPRHEYVATLVNVLFPQKIPQTATSIASITQRSRKPNELKNNPTLESIFEYFFRSPPKVASYWNTSSMRSTRPYSN